MKKILLIISLIMVVVSCNTNNTITTGNNLTGSILRTVPYPAPNTYASSKNVEVTLTSNRDATIYVTLDGSVPTPGRANTFSGKSPIYGIPIVQNTKLRFFAVDDSGNQETLKTALYYILKPPKSSIWPLPGAYNAPIKVTISTDRAATIYYTSNGYDPVTDDTVNTKSAIAPVKIDISKTGTLKYFAMDNIGGIEDIHSDRYIIDMILPKSTASPKGGNFSESVSVDLKITNDIGKIYYTLNGEDPSDKSSDSVGNGGSSYTANVKVSNLSVNESTVIKFFAIDKVGNREFSSTDNPPYNEEIYIIDDKPLVYAKPGGKYYTETNLDVDLITFPTSSKIYYSLSTTPTENSVYFYSGTIHLNGNGQHILKFFAEDNGNYSEMKTEVYNLGYVRPPETVTEDFSKTDYLDITSTTGVIVDTGNEKAYLDKYHAIYKDNIGSDDVNVSMTYYRDYLLVAERGAGVIIYDVSDISNISKVSTFDINPSGTGTGPYWDVETVSSQNIGIVSYITGVVIFDISDINYPSYITGISDLSQIFFTPPVIYTDGNYLFVGGFFNNNPTLFIYNLTTPINPVKVAMYEGVVNGPITELYKSNDELFITSQDGRLTIMDISDITSPDRKSRIKICDNCSTTSVKTFMGNAYVSYSTTNGGSVSVVDYSDPVSPAIIKSDIIDNNNQVQHLFLNNSLLCVSNANTGIRLLDISDVNNIVAVDTVTPSIAKNNAFIATESILNSDNLFVIDQSTGIRSFYLPPQIGDYLTLGKIYSFNVNPHELNIKGIDLSSVYTANNGSISFKVSPDNGTNWYSVSNGGYVSFPVTGYNLLWQGILNRGGVDKTPELDSVTLTIYYSE